MMHTLTRLFLTSLLLLFCSSLALARASQDPADANSRYDVERVSVSGVPDSSISQALRDDMQMLVGHKYAANAAERLARRLGHELGDRYAVEIKVRRGQEPEHVEIVFDVERRKQHRFDARVAPLLYTSHEGFSATIVPSLEAHHNYFMVGYTSDADRLLERNEGVMVRYEHRKVGTNALQLGVEYDYFHPSFKPEIQQALAAAPEVPGLYRNREVFSPSVSVLPTPGLKITFGASFQTLSMQSPTPHDQAAHAFTFGVQFHRDIWQESDRRNSVAAEYSYRNATADLHSDFLYTRHWGSADYWLRIGPHAFGVHGQAGLIDGQPPLFERFSLGNATTLRGWNKFDVAPLGGTRLAHGSLDYRFRCFELFYDVGSVWNPGQTSDLRHSMGVGLAWRNGFFVSVAYPLRYHSVTPTFMIGFRH